MSLGVFFTCEYENQIRKIVKVNKHTVGENNGIVYLDIVLSGNLCKNSVWIQTFLTESIFFVLWIKLILVRITALENSNTLLEDFLGFANFYDVVIEEEIFLEYFSQFYLHPCFILKVKKKSSLNIDGTTYYIIKFCIKKTKLCYFTYLSIRFTTSQCYWWWQ